jgi:nucleoside-diphosphate-sugar epimerase
MNIDKKYDKIMVTGGHGFLGKHTCKELEDAGYRYVRRVGRKVCNLTQQRSTNLYFRRIKPTVIIHLAGTVGGIGANQDNPGLFFYDNMQMGLNVLELGRKWQAKKIILIGTVCAYPKFTDVPFEECDLWKGYPEETNAPYGIAKRALMEMGQAYNKQYGMNIVNLIPVNMYGPGDNFNPEFSHVIPALILKFWDAIQEKKDEVEVWGSGMVSREFLYVKDCATAIRLAMEHYDSPEPINIGTGREVYINDLAHMIADQLNYTGKLVFNANYPDGQPRRCLHTDKAEKHLGWVAPTTLEQGLPYTIDWFKDNVDEITRAFRM